MQNEKSLLELGMIPSSTAQVQELKPIQGLNKDLLLEVDSDSCSQKSESDQMKQSMSSNDLTPPASIQKVDVEVQNLEKEDKIRVNGVRTSFYAINERFE